MARPLVSEATEELYEALDPAFTTGDEDRGWVVLNLCAAIVVGDLDRIHSYVTDRSDGRPGWQILFDPAECPAEALPYLAQFAGATLRPDMDEAQQRAAIQDPEVFRRGTPASIVAVAKRRLTGSQTVLLTERWTDNAYRMQLLTLEEETPDPDATLAELLAEAKPIGVRLLFNQSVPWTWAELRGEEATWADVASDFDTWLDLRTNTP